MKNQLQPTMVADLPQIDAIDIFQILELAQANGTLRFGADWLRLRGGKVVKASGDVGQIVARILRGEGQLTFRAVNGTPEGGGSYSITALLLEAARIADEVSK